MRAASCSTISRAAMARGIALTGPGGTRSYAELCAEAARWGHGFLSLGLKRGDRILMFLDDTPAYPAAFFGAVRAGFVPLLINTLTPPDLLQFYLTDAGASVAVADAEFASRFNAEACKDTPLHTLIVVNGAASGHAVPNAIVAEGWLQRFPTELAEADTGRDEMAFWMYSSGSTGRPKGIVHLQHDMAYSRARLCAQHAEAVKPDDICFSVPKIFFAYGFGNSITFPFSVGATTLLLPGQPKPATIFEAIGRFRPTVFFGLPTLYNLLTKAENAAAADFSSLRMALSAAEILAAEVFNGWKALTGLEIIEGLGSTEALHIYLSNSADNKKLGAAGRRVPGYEILLRDKDGREVGDNEEGIMWVRGDSNTPLYWNRPDKSAETIREGGWIYTGDRFVRDADGFHFFRGRADDLVKISGQWVYPLEVELCLADHPDVRECAVFAAELPDRRMTLKAVVVMNSRAFDERRHHAKAAGLRQGKAVAVQISARGAVSSTSCRRRGRARSIGRRCCGCRLGRHRPRTRPIQYARERLRLKPSGHGVLDRPAFAGMTVRSAASAWLTPQPRPAIQPRKRVVPFLRRLRAHDGVAQPGVLAVGMIDVLADRARHHLHPRGAGKALRPVGLQRRGKIIMLRQHVRQAHRVLHRLAGALREILQHRVRGIAEQHDAAVDPALGGIAVAQHPEPPVGAVADDVLRPRVHVAKALHHLGVRHRLACDRLRRVVVIGDDEVEHLPARERIMHDVAFRPGPQRRRIPAQVFRHLFGRDHRAIGRVAGNARRPVRR